MARLLEKLLVIQLTLKVIMKFTLKFAKKDIFSCKIRKKCLFVDVALYNIKMNLLVPFSISRSKQMTKQSKSNNFFILNLNLIFIHQIIFSYQKQYSRKQLNYLLIFCSNLKCKYISQPSPFCQVENRLKGLMRVFLIEKYIFYNLLLIDHFHLQKLL
ncbi:hypothetical protein ABPG74_016931 [Tetrahymena malaccensis]